MKKTPDFDAAAEFMATRARVLDRRVFQRLFQGGAPEPVRDAVAAYRNDDGGFGHALEPDLRAAAAIIYNPETNEVLWEENSQSQRSIASITKVMTATVFLEDSPDVTELVTIARSDVFQEK